MNTQEVAYAVSRDVNRKSEIWVSILNQKIGSIPLATGFQIYFLSLSSRKLHKHDQISDIINSHICLMFSVYKTFHEMANYCCQRNQILQDLNGPETLISIKASKIENWFETSFQQPKTSFAKQTSINILSRKIGYGE